MLITHTGPVNGTSDPNFSLVHFRCRACRTKYK